MSWEQAWQEGRTGWDAGDSAPALKQLVERKSLTGHTALIPGCGSGYDVFELAAAGFQATGLDLAPTSAKRFAALRDERGVDPAAAKIMTGDFFEHIPPDGGYDVIWDYTFMCALDPSQRRAWAEKMSDLVSPDGELITLIFPIEPIREDGGGPPFQLTPDDVVEATKGLFESTSLTPVTDSHPGRSGLEWLGRWKLIG